MEKLISILENLNFSKVEALIYIELIKESGLNGSQIAKKTGLTRSSVYNALDNLYSKGIVYLIPGKTNLYLAEKPELVVKKMKEKIEENGEVLTEIFDNMNNHEDEEYFYNMKGKENFVDKIKEVILNAKHEIYINTCLDLMIFESEIKAAREKGVRIIVFTYKNIDYAKLDIEIYYQEYPIELDENSIYEVRFMIVADLETTLICSRQNNFNEMTGTYTKNRLLAKIIAEHIHHDIYLMKLKKTEKRDLITDKILLNTLLEEN